jgi:malate dehydrogenase
MEKGAFFSVAMASDGSYGVEKGLIFGYPVRSGKNGCEIVQGIEHGAFALEKIKATHEELKAERDAVNALLK